LKSKDLRQYVDRKTLHMYPFLVVLEGQMSLTDSAMPEQNSDKAVLELLESAREDFRVLSEQRIQNGVRVQTTGGELDAACASALQIFGTDDPEVLLAQASENRRKNSEAVEGFVASIEDVKQKLRALHAATAQNPASASVGAGGRDNRQFSARG
jgi:hypothetical protein